MCEQWCLYLTPEIIIASHPLGLSACFLCVHKKRLSYPTQLSAPNGGLVGDIEPKLAYWHNLTGKGRSSHGDDHIFCADQICMIIFCADQFSLIHRYEVQQGQPDAVRRVFLRAVRQCPGCKALWLEGLLYAAAAASKTGAAAPLGEKWLSSLFVRGQECVLMALMLQGRLLFYLLLLTQ